ncbi:hypothetical protein D8I30_08660 [Brevundimonas naejangsanensis]|uniref:Uncharacterized protein n=1 Tax=Brevundimonas naejangsanensis TaxID=588932 RepID=A0A494RG07_9CAUL|nr:hypothetical protein D8I30_08660 [Brevundimonas naejangsanensis]
MPADGAQGRLMLHLSSPWHGEGDHDVVKGLRQRNQAAPPSRRMSAPRHLPLHGEEKGTPATPDIRNN